MRYRYFVDFGHGISVFHNFSFGIAVLGTPQCPPREGAKYLLSSRFSHFWKQYKTPVIGQ